MDAEMLQGLVGQKIKAVRPMSQYELCHDDASEGVLIDLGGECLVVFRKHGGTVARYQTHDRWIDVGRAEVV